jgi:hypothetical protein
MEEMRGSIKLGQKFTRFGIAVAAWCAACAVARAQAPATSPAPSPQASAAAPAKPAAESTTKGLTAAAQASLRQAFEQSGEKQAKQIFETEVLPEPLLFVSNYKELPDGTEIDVDKDKLTRYLRFSSSLYRAPGVCVKARAAAEMGTCPACEALVAPLERAISTALDTRGFASRPGPMMPDDASLSGDRAVDFYFGHASENACEGVLYAEITPERAADEDDEDDEIRVRAVTTLIVRDASGRKLKGRGTAVVEVPKELGGTAAARQFVQRIVRRTTAEMYSQAVPTGATPLASSLAAGAGGAIPEERLLKLAGVANYAAYAKFKQMALQAMPELRLEERFISPGEFQFVVGGTTPLPEVVAKLKAISWDGQTLEIVGAGDSEASVVFK